MRLRNLILILLVFAVFIIPLINEKLLSLGLFFENVNIAGTGSMYPTFPKGESTNEIVNAKEIVAWPKMRRFSEGLIVYGFKILSSDVHYGDIVEFENEATKQLSIKKYGTDAGFIKRVIAIPGDRIELKDGFVYRNNIAIDEPYIAKPRSTYGGKLIEDCKSVIVPDNKYVVLGDNRKASLDSRFELGFIDKKDINYILPWPDQKEYHIKWRNTSGDALLAQTTTFDPLQFVTLINDERRLKKIKPFIYKVKLTSSSKMRALSMIKTNDFSVEATKSGLTLAKSVKNAGYSNVIYAEVFTRGFYEAGELFDNFTEFPDTQKLLLSSDYQDIGLSAVVGLINDCPTQVITAHLGGYIPPDYSTEEINSWKKLIDNLKNVIPDWENLKGKSGMDNQLNHLIEILKLRLTNASRIYTRLSARQWLTEDEKKAAQNDKNLAEEADKIIGGLYTTQ